MKIFKIGLIGDGHHGTRSGSHFFRDFQKDYLFNYLIPYYKERGITELVELGDWFDTRRYVLALDYHWMIEELIPVLAENGMTLHMVIGNHCLALKDSVHINHNRILEKAAKAHGSNCIKIYEEPEEVRFGDTDCLFLPWICESNYKQVVEAIDKSTASVVFAHLELESFVLSKGQLCEKGTICTSLFEKFDKVYTGHFHHTNHKTLKSGTLIKYVGVPYEQSWADYDYPAENGIYVMDCLTTELEFIPNKPTQSMFQTLTYDYEEIESSNLVKKYLDVDYLNDTLGLKGSVVRIEVFNKDNSSHYKRFIAALRLVDCVNFTTQDLTNEVETVEQEVKEVEWKAS
ncbi:MAG: hypothetical protein GY928_22605, partial [Colwellia sp.]|nr:hypothetical protein [Colwellia sp.]